MYGLPRPQPLSSLGRYACASFADLLTPTPPRAPTTVVPGAFPRLPQPTEDRDQAKRDVVELGYGLFNIALTPQQIAILKRVAQEQTAGENAAGGGRADAGGAHPRTWTLIHKGDEFRDFRNHPLIDALVPWFLGEHALIHSYSAKYVSTATAGLLPTHLPTNPTSTGLTSDNVLASLGPAATLCNCTQTRSRCSRRRARWRSGQRRLNLLWFLEHFSEANGGTRMVPASHIGAIAPEDIFHVDGTLAAKGSAGTRPTTDSRIWHATGPNRAAGGERPAIMVFFMRSFIRQQENNFLSLRKDVEARLSDRQKKTLSVVTTGALGGREGEVREGIFVQRREDCVGKTRAPHVPKGAAKEEAKEATKEVTLR